MSEGQAEADGFDAMVGLRERAVGEGRAEIALVAEAHHLNPAGVVHGGAIATLVNVAMGKAVGSLNDDDETPVTIEMKVNYLEPGRPGLARRDRRGAAAGPPVHGRSGGGDPGRGRGDPGRGDGHVHQRRVGRARQGS